MKKENFLKAIEIISEYHTTKMIINKPVNGFVGDLGSKEWSINIISCCTSVINGLTDAGFSLTMLDGMLSLADYSVYPTHNLPKTK